MNIKQYTIFRLIVVVIIALSISFLVTQKNYVLSMVVMTTGMLVMYNLKKRVREVLADERDYRLAGRSAMAALYIYSLVGTFGGFILLAFSGKNQNFEQFAYMIFYSVCVLMLLNSLIFIFYRRRGDK